MSKRKQTVSLEDDLGRLYKKMKKLEKKIRSCKENVEEPPEPDPGEGTSGAAPGGADLDMPELWLATPEHDAPDAYPAPTPAPGPAAATVHDMLQQDPPGEIYATNQQQLLDAGAPVEQSLEELISSLPAPPLAGEDNMPDTVDPVDLDDEVLKILGEDPSSTTKYGPEIRKELASRLQHIATEGLSKESRTELIRKYPLPSNCLSVGAPSLNPELKLNLQENSIKRDKGIESKQSQIASAISCLTEVISLHLNSKERNNTILQKLMDAARILCDIQHGDSVTRRNFIVFGVRNDMQEPLRRTKIDTFLFGENLPETLRSAKAVNKSSAELKVPESSKNSASKTKFVANQNLNRKAAPARRPAGAATAPPPRYRREPAPRAQRPPPAPPAPAYRTSWTQPPPPPPPRRRY
ncbi:unnamed protein product [Plutella xylostella]|uniref:(diamondback moth) hypothetical protein n=1 Tax=Plutella xylostella TaxID=51655 RepID=A0A8S4GB26_PLUXY|nr:unnamed protein product [Plutella xylostella]